MSGRIQPKDGRIFREAHQSGTVSNLSFNKLLSKWFAGIATALLLAFVGVTYALNHSNKTSGIGEKGQGAVTQAVTWYYNGTGTTESDFQNGTNWSQTNSGSCVTNGNRPCQISSDATTQTELSSELSELNRDEILAMSSGRKP